MLKQVIDRLKQQDYNVEFDDKVKEYISKKGVDINYGLNCFFSSDITSFFVFS